MDPHVAGRTARSLETLHALSYFAPEVGRDRRAGVRPGRATYFASRAAAMGRVGPRRRHRDLLRLQPRARGPVLPPAWEATSPEEVVAARLRGVDAAYRRLLGDEVTTAPEVKEAAELTRAAAAACDPAGRPLYAAHADLEWPASRTWRCGSG